MGLTKNTKIRFSPFIIVTIFILSSTPSELTGKIAWSSSAFTSEEYYEWDEITHFESRVYVAQDVRLVTLPDDIPFDETICGFLQDIADDNWDCTSRNGNYLEKNRFSVDMYLAYQYNLHHTGNVNVKYITQLNSQNQLVTDMEIINSTEEYSVEAKVAFVFEINRVYAPSGAEIEDWNFSIPFPSLLDVDGDGSSVGLGNFEIFTWDNYVTLNSDSGLDMFGSVVDLSGYVNLAEIELLELASNILADMGNPYTYAASKAIDALRYVIEIYLTLSLDMEFKVQAAAQTIIDTQDWSQIRHSYNQDVERQAWGNFLGFTDDKMTDGYDISETHSTIISSRLSNTAHTKFNILYIVSTYESYSINLEFRPSHRSLEIGSWDLQIGLLAWEVLGLPNPIRVPLVDGLLATRSTHEEIIYAHDRGVITVPMVAPEDNAVPQVSISGPMIGDVGEWVVFDVQAFDADGDDLFYRYSNGEDPFNDWTAIPFAPRFDHTFQTPGEHLVSIQVRDQYSTSEIASYRITINEPAPPTAVLMVNDTSPRAGDEITFIWSADNMVSNAFYDLSFGDGTWHNTSSGGTMIHTYSDSGLYYPTLIITPTQGAVITTDIELELRRIRDPNATYDINDKLVIAESDILIVVDLNDRIVFGVNNLASQNTNPQYNMLNANDSFVAAVQKTANVMEWNWNLTIVGDLGEVGTTYTRYEDGPSPGMLQKHRVVIWNTGPGPFATLTQTDQDNLAEYVDSGGRLILFSQNLLFGLGFGTVNWSQGDFALDILGVEVSYQDNGLGSQMNGNYVKEYVKPLEDQLFSGLENIELRKLSSFTNQSDRIIGVGGSTISGMWATDSFGFNNGTHAVANYSNQGTQYEGRTVFFSFDPVIISKRFDLERLLLQTIEWALTAEEDDGVAERAVPLYLDSRSRNWYGTTESTYEAANPDRDTDWMKFRVSRGHQYQIFTGQMTSGVIYGSDATTLVHTMNGSYWNFTANKSGELYLKVTTTNSGGSYRISFIELVDEWSAYNSAIPLQLGKLSATTDDMVTPGEFAYYTTMYKIPLLKGKTYALSVDHNQPATDNLTYTWAVINQSLGYLHTVESQSGQSHVELTFTTNFTGDTMIIVFAHGYANPLTFDGNYQIEVFEVPSIHLADTESTAYALNRASGATGGWVDAEYDPEDWWTFEVFSGEVLELDIFVDREIRYYFNATWVSADDSNDNVQFFTLNGLRNMTVQFPHLGNGFVTLQITALKGRSGYTFGMNELDETLIESGTIMRNSNGIHNSNEIFEMTFTNDADILIRAGPSTDFVNNLTAVSDLSIVARSPDGTEYLASWQGPSGFLSLKIPAGQQGVWQIKVTSGVGGYWLWVGEDQGLAWSTHPQRYSVVEVPFSDTHTAYRQYQTETESSVLESWMTYNLQSGPTGMSVNSSTGELQFTPTRSQEGNHSVSVMVIDEWNDVLYQNFTLEVSALPNTPPVWVDFGAGLRFTAGQSSIIQTSAFDADGDTLNYAILTGPDGMAINSDGTISWTPLLSGIVEVTIRVTDQTGNGQSLPLIVVIENEAPYITQKSRDLNIVSNFGDDVSLQLNSIDPEGSTVSWTILAGPWRAQISNTGLFTMTPSPEDIGEHEILIMLSDSFGSNSTFVLNLIVKRPSIGATELPNSTISAGQMYTLSIPESNQLAKKITLLQAPLGVQVYESGYIQWRPEGDQVGSFQIQLAELYADGTIEIITLNLTVENNAPIIIIIGIVQNEADLQLRILVVDDVKDNVNFTCSGMTAVIDLEHGLFAIVLDDSSSSVNISCRAVDSHDTTTYLNETISIPSGSAGTGTDDAAGGATLSRGLAIIVIVGLVAVLVGIYIGARSQRLTSSDDFDQ